MSLPATDDKIPHHLYKVTLQFARHLDGDKAQVLGDALEDLVSAVSLHNREATDGDDWTISLTNYGTPDLDAIYQRLEETESGIILREKITAERLPEKDWLRHVHDNFPPVNIGRFFVHGSYYKGEMPAGQTPLQIDAATAFGSGEHETTRSCMVAFEQIAKEHQVKNALDMGCGSGILAIAIQKIWPGAKLTAIDIDPESVIVTNRHADMNGVTLQAAAGDGYKTPLSIQNAPYDLVGANILAGPLIAMSGDLYNALKPGGFAVLSGLLKRQQQDVTDAHLKAGLKLIGSIPDGDWAALIFQRDK
ncbi:MAG: ribosomal protein methyltransferase [Alphaproteobacteria bacterium]|jgi:ribosomal protein L11 methyltransferase|nr:ribosomal protein methyltransferase [Alphaproteobacteria bacterium]